MAKPFKGLKGVMEIVERYATDAYRAMYVEVISKAFVGAASSPWTAPVGGFRGSGPAAIETESRRDAAPTVATSTLTRFLRPLLV